MVDSVRPTVAVTGANGYIGYQVCRVLNEAGLAVRPIVRSLENIDARQFEGMETVVTVGNLSQTTDWNAAVSGIDCVIHTAGMVHKPEPTTDYARVVFDSVNCDATMSLASAAVKHGVKRFVFLSSISVYGSIADQKLAEENMQCQPIGAYATSKFEAERALNDLACTSTMQIAIVRPPMVYGPNAPGNIKRLAKLVQIGLPLPFGNLKSRRHLIGVGNLCSFISMLVSSEISISGTWNVADNEEVDIPSIVRSLARGMGKKQPIVLPVPLPVLNVLAAFVRQGSAIDKLNSSVRVDSAAVHRTFGWRAPISTNDGLEETGFAFQSD